MGRSSRPEYLEQAWARYRTNPPTFVNQANRVEDTRRRPGGGVYPGRQHLGERGPAGHRGHDRREQQPGRWVLERQYHHDRRRGRHLPTLRSTTVARSASTRCSNAELAGELATEVDSYAITQALSTAGSVTSGSRIRRAGVLGDIGKARKQMTSTAGVNLGADGSVHGPGLRELGAGAVGQLEPASRRPHTAACGAPDPTRSRRLRAVRPTGYQVLGTAALLDGNIAASVSSSQIILASMPEVYVLQSEPVLRVIPETLAADLEVTVPLVSYAASSSDTAMPSR